MFAKSGASQRSTAARSPASEARPQRLGKPASTGLLRPALSCACGGGCPRCQMSKLQRKAQVSMPGDAHEREADDVADRVMRMAPLPTIGRVAQDVHRARSSCEENADDPVEFLRAASPGADKALDTELALYTAGTGGIPLSPTLRAEFEPRFGHDFSQVRVHTDGEAARAARAVQARAYTYQRDIVFASGAFAPQTTQGRRLLVMSLPMWCSRAQATVHRNSCVNPIRRA